MNLLSACLSVADLEASIQWYCQKLGFAEIQKEGFPQYGDRIAFLRAGKVELELVQDSRFTPSVRPDPPGHLAQQGVSQISFWITGIERRLAQLKEDQVPIVWDLVKVEDFGLKAFFIRDLDGNLIEFKERYLQPEETRSYCKGE